MINKRSFGLDLLRAIAISLVLLAHFVKAFDKLGFWGVELFFALSGFLIGKILWNSFSQNQYFSLPLVINFWQRRWWRTIPNYWLFLLVMIVYQFLRSNELTNWDIILKSIFFLQNFSSREVVFFSVSWSLCVEEWFYLTFPLVLFLLAKLNLSKPATFSICIVVFIICSILLRAYFIQKGVGHSLRGITLARLDAIVFGVFTANALQLLNTSIKLKFYMLCSGIILLFFCIIKIHFSAISYEEIRSQQMYLLLAPLSFALIIPSIEKINFSTYQFKWIELIIQKMSLWSYSIYLSHIPILFTVYYLTESFRTTNLGNIFSKIIGLFLTLFISAFIYQYFEKPLTNKRPKEIGGKLR
jgi:peptidoglycan/LPS O-acetylase OafA/YrhL